MEQPFYKRVLLKLSGEALQGNLGYGFCPKTVDAIIDEIVEVVKLGIELGIVIGGGNIFRGLKGVSWGIDRVESDYMGMLATIINSIALQNILEKKGVIAHIHSPFPISQVTQPYIIKNAINYLEKKEVVIFAGGTGNPYFTTDTASALRASEIKADVLLKATQVDGVYENDPKIDKSAKKIDKITYTEVLEKKLKIMDLTAIAHCMENNIKIVVFKLSEKGNMKKVVLGEKIGTVIY